MAGNWASKLEEAVPILTLGAGLLALFLGVDNWWVIFVMGWVVATPLVSILVDEDDETERTLEPPSPPSPSEWGGEDTDAGAGAGQASQQDALETLRDRYARGELTEEQFERKVERLLETETVEDARERVVEDAERERER